MSVHYSWAATDRTGDPDRFKRLVRSLNLMMESNDKGGFAAVTNVMLEREMRVEDLNVLLGPAAIHEDLFFLDFLLAIGCDINAVNKHGSGIGVFVIERLDESSAFERLPDLIERGLDVAKADQDGFQMIHHAALQDKGEIILYLVRLAKIAIDTQTEKGETCLMLAAYYGHLSALQAAISLSADIALRDSEQKTALDYASCPLKGDELDQKSIVPEKRAQGHNLLKEYKSKTSSRASP